ncbi:MAG: membrane dipeptidase [Acidobacteriaceae bacterium]
MKVPLRFAPVVSLGAAVTMMLATGQSAIAQIEKQPPIFRQPVASFANIVVTVQGPNTVKIAWYPLPGADQYQVYRTMGQPPLASQIGPDYPSATDAAQWVTVYDYNAPASTALSYYVTAAQKEPILTMSGTVPGSIERWMATSNSVAVNTPALPAVPVWGFADLHAHPATFLAFGADAQGDADYAFSQNNGILWGKTGLDLATASTDAAIAANLPACDGATHSGFDADAIRHAIHGQLIQMVSQQSGYPHSASGYPGYNAWPAAQDLLHQAMYITEIRRAYEGGLRMMFASTTDNEIIYDLWHTGSNANGNPIPTPTPLFDYLSAIRQLNLIQQLVGANSDWMQIVTSSADARQAIQNNKLAVVLSVEMDALTMDNLQDLVQNHQVRHIIPIHLTNNAMGGMALYGDPFNTNTYFHTGNFYSVRTDPCVNYSLGRPLALEPDPSLLGVGGALGGISPQPINDAWFQSLNYPVAWAGSGERNGQGLAQPEQFVQLMQKGVMLDLAHMGEQSAADALSLAEKYQFPLMDSHTGLRDDSTCYPTLPAGTSERAIPYSQVKRLAALGGVLGLGTADNSGPDPVELWLQNYKAARALMGGRGVALGTDFDGLSPQIVGNAYNIQTPYPITVGSQLNPPDGITLNALDKFKLGNRSFDFTTDGLANYGMLPDFLEAVWVHPPATWTPAAGPPPYSNPDAIPELTALFHSAEDVIDMWAKDEQAAGNIPSPETVQCSVFDDGYTNLAGPGNVILINANLQACIPNGSGADCRKWFGRCTTSVSNNPVTFSTFDDGYANASASSDAIFVQSVNGASASCVPGGSNGICHKWFGRGMTQDGRKVLCDLTSANANDFAGPTDAIYPLHLSDTTTNPTDGLISMNQMCLPDGTATGTCRARFGSCFVAVQ